MRKFRGSTWSRKEGARDVRGSGSKGKRAKQGGIVIAEPASTPTRRDGDTVFSDRNLTISRTLQPAGLRLAGEIDVTNSRALGRSLRAGFAGGDIAHLDLGGVVFSDISGIRALVMFARELRPPRKLVLHGLPTQLESVIRVTGWADLPGLEICNCEAEG